MRILLVLAIGLVMFALTACPKDSSMPEGGQPTGGAPEGGAAPAGGGA